MNVIADVVGYYIPSSLTEIQARLVALEAEDVAINARITDQRPTTQSVDGGDRTVGAEWTNVLELAAPISRTGRVLVFVSASASESTAGHEVQCVITDTPDSVVANRSMLWEAPGASSGSAAGEGDAAVMAGTRSFAVTGGTSGRFALICRSLDGPAESTSTIREPHISVLFIRN